MEKYVELYENWKGGCGGRTTEMQWAPEKGFIDNPDLEWVGINRLNDVHAALLRGEREGRIGDGANFTYFKAWDSEADFCAFSGVVMYGPQPA